jgi:hypothetical protein
MIMDSLKLVVQDFSVSIELPSNLNNGSSNGSNSVLVLGGDLVEAISLGRIQPAPSEEEEKGALPAGGLEQKVVLRNLFSHILINDQKEKHPLLVPFSYQAQATRPSGQRFDSFLRNMKFVGGKKEEPNEQSSSALCIHVGALQIQTLSQLSVLLLAPPSYNDEIKQGNKEQNPSAAKNGTESSKDNGTEDDSSPSTFDFGLEALILKVNDNHLELPNVRFYYSADGTVMNLAAESLHVKAGGGDDDDSEDKYNTTKANVAISGISASLVAPMTVTLDSIQELYIADTLQLTKPINLTKLIKEGQTYSIVLDSIHAELIQGTKQNKKKTEQDKPSTNSGPPLSIPFPVSLSLNELRLTKEADGGSCMAQVEQLNVYATPTVAARGGTEWAIELRKLQNALIQVEDAQVFGLYDGPSQMSNLRVSIKETQVTAGQPTEEWQSAFQPKRTAAVQQEKLKNQAQPQQQVVWKLPNAYVDPLKLTIS